MTTLRRKTTLALGTLAPLLASMSCSPGGPTEPQPSSAIVSVIPASGAQPAAPLRMAVIWRHRGAGEQHWGATYDAPLRELGISQATLSLPPPSKRLDLSDTSTVYVACAPRATVGTRAPENTGAQEGGVTETITAPVALPRVVVYEDVDRDGRLNPDLPMTAGVDRLWGISEDAISPIMAFRDLDQTLSNLPLEAAECLRSITDGTYSEFFQVNTRAPMEVPLSTIRVFIHLSSTDYARVVMSCSVANENALSTPSDPIFETPRSWVDASLGIDPCSDELRSCTRTNAAMWILPELTNYSDPGYVRASACYAFGELDVLTLTETRLVCDGCQCHWQGRESSWVTDSARAPAEWPCGTTVQYCAKAATSLWNAPSPCALTRLRPE